MIEGEIYQSFRVMVLGVMSGYGKYGQDSYLYICIYVSYVTLCITSRVQSTEYGVHNLCTLYIHTRDHGNDF